MNSTGISYTISGSSSVSLVVLALTIKRRFLMLFLKFLVKNDSWSAYSTTFKYEPVWINSDKLIGLLNWFAIEDTSTNSPFDS